GDPLAALVAEGVVGGDVDEARGDELEDEQGEQDPPQVVPVPAGAGEEVVGGAIAAEAVQQGELPDLGEGARPQAGEPGLDDGGEGGERLGAEAAAEVA